MMSTMTFNKSISVFFPAYNEEENIRDVVLEANEYLKPRFKDYEILVISCASTDRTNAITLELAKSIPQLRLVTKDVNTGYAGSLRAGFLNASKELIFYTDGDHQFDIKELDKLLPLIEKYDIVTGHKIKRNDPLMRLWMSWLYNRVMRLLFGLRGLKVKDVNCAFKLYKREVIKKVNFLPNLTQGVINTEIYVSALQNGYKIGEVPVNHYSRTKGSGGDAEIGPRGGRFFAFVRPVIIWRFLKDTFYLWRKVYGRTKQV